MPDFWQRVALTYLVRLGPSGDRVGCNNACDMF
jgi:hypothetical protein